jgi:hypothetical protein
MRKQIELDIARVLQQLGMDQDKYMMWINKEAEDPPHTAIENVRPSQN